MEMTIKRRKNLIQTAPAYRNEPTPHRKIQFEEIVKTFLYDCRAKNLAIRTIQFYEVNLGYLKKAFEQKGIELDVTTVAPRDIKNHFIGDMFERGLASNTVNGRIKSCKAFFKYIYKEGLTPHNLAMDLDLVKAEKKMIQTFTKEQVIQILNCPDRNSFTGFRDYTIMMVLLETGIRIGELLELKVSDINFKEGEIRILKGKGRKARRVPIQKICCQVLKKYLTERGETESEALFINVDNGPLKMRTIQENIQNYGKMLRISGVRVSPHTFRHTMSKFYILNGGDVFTLQQILGHSTLDMVRYYVELFSTDIKEQHQKYSPVENISFR